MVYGYYNMVYIYIYIWIYIMVYIMVYDNIYIHPVVMTNSLPWKDPPCY